MARGCEILHFFVYETSLCPCITVKVGYPCCYGCYMQFDHPPARRTFLRRCFKARREGPNSARFNAAMKKSCTIPRTDVYHSLNSLKGGYIGDYIGDYYRGY